MLPTRPAGTALHAAGSPSQFGKVARLRVRQSADDAARVAQVLDLDLELGAALRRQRREQRQRGRSPALKSPSPRSVPQSRSQKRK